jgi:hypothetical protein
LVAAASVLMLVGCGPDGQMNVDSGQLRGATVAFESIDGPPSAQFQKLVQNLNDEAQARRLAVVARDKSSAYRVRGYLAANVAADETTVSWVWDVFDKNERRALRITGAETAKSLQGWTAADDDMMKRVAHRSMDQLSAFLISPEVAPSTTPGPLVVPTSFALTGQRDNSPESAGIFRIFRGQVTDDSPLENDETASPVPLPRGRPADPAAVSASETLTLSASRGSSLR